MKSKILVHLRLPEEEQKDSKQEPNAGSSSSSKIDHITAGIDREMATFIDPVITKEVGGLPKGTKDTAASIKVGAPADKPKSTNSWRVGVWDLGAWVGNLPSLLGGMNEVQDRFEFTTVQAPVPVGMIQSKDGIQAWAKTKKRKWLDDEATQSKTKAMIAPEFFDLARSVRSNLQVDYLIGVTPATIADLVDDKEDEIYADYYSDSWGKVALVSTTDLRTYAAQTGIPFESFLGNLIVGQILVMCCPRVGFHSEHRDCVFDFNETRLTLMDSQKNLRIDPKCLNKIQENMRHIALALVEFVKSYNKNP